MKKNEVFKKIQTKILELMETEGTNWTKSWLGCGRPTNAITKRQYRGMNHFWLAVQGFTSNEWATFKQWSNAGHKVKKGSTASHVVFCEVKDKKEEWLNDNERAEFLKTGKLPKYWLWKVFPVFNADQIDGYVSDNIVENQKTELTIDEASEIQSFIDNCNAEITHGGDVACYIPSSDKINMPEMKSFFSDVDYFSTLLHELTHWTREEGRTNRQDKDLEYAQEELVAEIGSAFLCQLLGVEKTVRPDHAQYLNAWKERIADSEKAMISAFSDAQKAVDFLTNLQEKKEREAA